MYMKSTRFTLQAIVFCATIAEPALAEAPPQIAVAGLYEWKEQIRPGGDWWGIFPDGNGYTLQPTRVRAISDPDMVIPPEKPPRQIRVPDGNNGVIVFRGLMSAAAGPLNVVDLPPYPAPLQPGKSVVLMLRSGPEKAAIRITAEPDPAPPHPSGGTQRAAAGYQLVLQRGGEKPLKQVLYTRSQIKGEGPRLRWAGDLDRDGYVDLIYNFGEHHTETKLMLFLSSAAKEGEIVGLVAQWTGTCGC
ncbi:MAG: hypothetical protein KF886_01885 [Candidatus Hydrogenedentes bacterium]|nr:hypothetical protein [Candidatus Hydrogenedentota bacterium]